MPEEKVITEYDSEPVRYCSKCYSLKIKYEEAICSEYCGNCGCTDVSEAPFEVWEKKYEKRYGHKFAVKTEDPKKSFVFSLTLEEIKEKVYKSTSWKEIIKAMYPRFPGGLGKADSIILFFHTIIKENKLNDLKLLLLKRFKY